MILVSILLEARGKPSVLRRVGYHLVKLVRCNSDFYRPVRDGILQECSVGPIDCNVRAIIVGMAALLESVIDHRVQYVDEVSAIEHAVCLRPLLNFRVGDKDLRLMASFGESLLRRDSIAVYVIQPK